jgi:putative MATE family efflux protein
MCGGLYGLCAYNPAHHHAVTTSTLRSSAPPLLEEATLNRSIARLAAPAVLENLLNTVLFIVNTLLIGWLREAAALAGIGVGNTFQLIAQSIFMALGVAALALVARAWGAQDRDGARKTTAHAIVLTGALSLVIMLPMLALAEPFMRLLLRDADPDRLALAITYSVDYTRILLLVAPLAYGRIVMSAIMRASGDTRTPMLITLLVNVLNVALAVPLIFGAGDALPGMGVRGAAIAVAAAQSAGGALSLAALLSGRQRLQLKVRDLLTCTWAGVWRILRVALPNMAESAVQRVGFVTYMSIVGGLGTASIAAHQIANSIESVSYMPAQGLATATAALVGQALGARNIRVAELAVKRSGLFGMLVMLIFGTIFVIFGRSLATLYGAQDDVLELAATAVSISALELPTLAIYNIYSGALRGAGDTRSPMLVSLIGAIFFRVAAVWLLAVYFGLGLAGVWYGTAIDWAGRAVIVYVLYRGGRWQRIRV